MLIVCNNVLLLPFIGSDRALYATMGIDMSSQLHQAFSYIPLRQCHESHSVSLMQEGINKTIAF